MAIVMEEEKRRVNWFAVVIVILIVAALGSAIYYLFFTETPLIEKVVPDQVQSINNISASNFDPGSLKNSPQFKALEQYVSPLDASTSVPARQNPFAPLFLFKSK